MSGCQSEYDPALTDPPSVVSDSRNERQKVDRKIEIANGVGCKLVGTDGFGIDPVPAPDGFLRSTDRGKTVVKPASKISLTKATSLVPVISYKFNEGNFAAVRKAAKVSSFL